MPFYENKHDYDTLCLIILIEFWKFDKKRIHVQWTIKDSDVVNFHIKSQLMKKLEKKWWLSQNVNIYPRS